MMRLQRLVCRSLALAYPIALACIILSFRLVGERWWGTTAALYVPRVVFALPLLPLATWLLWLGQRRLLWSQAAAALLLFPLLGWQVSWPAAANPGRFLLRVVSCNVETGALGTQSVIAMLRATDADVIVLQEVHPSEYDILRAGMAGYSIREAGQFWLASRFPVQEVFEPPKFLNAGVLRSLRFVRYTLSTPQGPLLVYNMHPISPRDGLEDLRGQGLRHQIGTGQIFNAAARAAVRSNAALRLAQISTMVADASRYPYPVLFAGDTNLPGLSWAFAQQFGAYTDGFAEAGNGFGYTFPAPRHPWMRIDRIVADHRFRFLDFKVIHTAVSDHYAVMAELEERAP
jgi:endonuclease/exonuclease/phosphatase (EEP) superfamily protein YafD